MATNNNSSKSNSNSNYGSNTQLVKRDAVTLAKVRSIGLVLGEEARNNLISIGMSEGQINEIVTTCIALGIKPNLLVNPANIDKIIQAKKYATDYNMVPGKHFFGVSYNGKSKFEDEEGRSIEVSMPNLSIQFAYGFLEHCVEQYGKSIGITFYLDQRRVTDEAEIAEVMAHHFTSGVPVPHPNNRVHKARYIPLIPGIRDLPEPDFQYGFYLELGVKKEGWTSASKYGNSFAADFRQGPDVARTRAIRAACLAVTGNIYPVRGDGAEELSRLAAQNAAKYEELARSGVNVEEALDGDYEMIEEAPGVVGAAAIDARPDANALFEFEQLPETEAVDAVPTELEQLFAALDKMLDEDQRKFVSEIRSINEGTAVKSSTVERLTKEIARLGEWNGEEVVAGYPLTQVVLSFMGGDAIGQPPRGGVVRALAPIAEGTTVYNPQREAAVWGIVQLVNALTVTPEVEQAVEAEA